MNYTSIEQSKKLVELGLSRDTADMVYKYNFLQEVNDETPMVILGNLHDTSLHNIPCWSLGALLELMPTSLPLYPEATEEGVKEGKYRSSDLIASKEGYLRKRFDSTYQYRYDEIHIVGDYNTPLEAAYNMVVWLLENNYIKKEKI